MPPTAAVNSADCSSADIIVNCSLMLALAYDTGEGIGQEASPDGIRSPMSAMAADG